MKSAILTRRFEHSQILSRLETHRGRVLVNKKKCSTLRSIIKFPMRLLYETIAHLLRSKSTHQPFQEKRNVLKYSEYWGSTRIYAFIWIEKINKGNNLVFGCIYLSSYFQILLIFCSRLSREIWLILARFFDQFIKKLYRKHSQVSNPSALSLT